MTAELDRLMALDRLELRVRHAEFVGAWIATLRPTASPDAKSVTGRGDSPSAAVSDALGAYAAATAAGMDAAVDDAISRRLG